MQIQLIQKKAQIGSQIELILTTGDKISGLLKEIGLEHVTLDASTGEMTVSAESIITIQSIDNINTTESSTNIPYLDHQVNTSESSNSKPNNIEVPNSINLSQTEIEVSKDTDANTEPITSMPKEVEASDATETKAELTDSVTEEVETPDEANINTEMPKEVEASDATETRAESTDSVTEELEAPDEADVNTEMPKGMKASDATETRAESTDSVTEELEAPDEADVNTESNASVNFEEQASEKLIEIEKRFSNQIESAKLELEPPDLTFPAEELTGWQSTTIAGEWIRIKNKYENAQKINELSPKFGRIQPLVIELKSLVKRFPNSPSLKRVFAYFSAISDNWQEAAQIYQEVAVTSDSDKDWFNLAVSALILNKEELACYSLEKFFNSVSIIDEPNAWYVYVDLVKKFNNLSTFRELCRKGKNDVTENEIAVLLDAAIYLLKRKVTTELAIEVIQKRMKGEPGESLLKEVCQKLGGQSTESYRQFLAEFINAMIASEKIASPLTPEYPERSGAVKNGVHHIPSQKQDMQTQAEDPYAGAKHADLVEKDLEKAERLFRKCISQNIRHIRHDSAIKDLAMVLVRLERPGEAVELLENKRSDIEDKQSLDNTLITVYPAAGQYEKAIDLLSKTLNQTSEKGKKVYLYFQIASNYIKLRNYASAEDQFRQVLKLSPYNITAQRSLALCFSKQDRYGEAKKILNQIQRNSPDRKTAALLEAVERAQRTGEFILDDESIIEIETALSHFSSELSEFAQFFLERCEFDGVLPARVNDGTYIGSEKDFQHDIARLEDVAKQLGTRRPRDRGHYYLSAARIYFDLGVNQNFFYRYLCRSFASRGDAAVSENKHLDTVREWYCEALTAYDGDKTRRRRDEQDAVNSLVRYLYSTLGYAHIDLAPNTQTFNKVVNDVVNNHPDKKKVFDSVAYLVLHSRFAADRVLNRLYDNETLRAMAIDYLKGMDIEIPDVMERLVDFVRPWNELRNEKFNAARNTSDKLRLLNNFDLTTSWLEDNIRFAADIRSSLFFELDQQRVGELQRVLESALELCKQVTFEERERLCFQLDDSCQTLCREIVESPTKLSVEDVYPIIEIIQDKVNAYLDELYETSKPQLILRLPVESYVPDTNRKIEVQLVVQNEKGRSPAESLALVVEKDQASFMVTEPEIKRDESLRGGEQSILKVPLRVTDETLVSQTFSLPVYAQYRTRAGEQEETLVENFSIRLYSEDEFETIKNPYAAYAEGGIVGDPIMFFGRDELIQNIARAIQSSRLQSKCVLVFGQKRSGKSSVLYHLKKTLEKDSKLLVLDLGNIGTLSEDSSVPLLYRILRRILTELEDAVEDRVDEGLPPLGLSIPGDDEFYKHPDPLQRFENIFRSLKRYVSKQESWHGVKVVLLIDEFQYIYDRILAGKIPESFMQSWKALLQANYFHAVLVGQDVMPKFKLRFPNEFGTTQDERVTYLKPDDARSLIDEPIRIGGRQGESRYREQAIEQILELTAGSPFYIQMLCNRLVEYMNVKHAHLVTEADVEQVKNELISGVNALDLDKFDNLINSGDTSADAISDNDALKVLKVIADNSVTGPCHRDRIDCKTSLPIDTILDDLEKRDIVERREQFYQIQVRLFKEWLIVNR